MKIYTRTGDRGTTSLVGGTRVSKASPRLEAYGTADELNSHIGLLLSLPGLPEGAAQTLTHVQRALFNLGSELATEPESPYKPVAVAQADIDLLESEIDRIDPTLPAHNRFILPAGTQAAAQAHVARTVARRCERRMVEMADAGLAVSDTDLKFVNRLSDYLFVLARQINHAAGAAENFW